MPSEREPRGGDRVRVGTKHGRVVKCGRTHDKAAKRGRRVYLIRFDDGSEERLSRVSFEVISHRSG